MALDFGAGCIGGIVGVTVGHPFDTVKVRLQTQSATNPLYKGTYDCFRSIIKQESVFGLFKGITSPLYGLAGINAIVFGIQGNVQRRLSNPNSLSSHCIGGAIAGASQCIICSPMELAKTRIQVQGQGESLSTYRHTRHVYSGPVDCLIKIYKSEGVRGVFRGMGLTLVREVPSFGVYFMSYEYFCRKFAGKNERNGVFGLLMAGGLAGMASWLTTYPADVIKSRIQADMSNEYKGFLDCCKKSYHSEGIKVFSKGLGSTLLRAFPVNAATFATVELVFRFVKDNDGVDDGSYDMSSYSNIQSSPNAQNTVALNVIPSFPSP